MNTIELRPAVIYAFGHALGWFLLALLFSAGAIVLMPGLVLIAAGFAVFGAWCFAQVRAIHYTIGEEELKVRTGVLFRRTDHLEWFRVKDYVESQPLIFRLFNLIHIELLTKDLTNPFLRLSAVPCGDLIAIIRERVQLARKNNPVVELE